MKTPFLFYLVISIHMGTPTEVPAGSFQTEAECQAAGKQASEMINLEFEREKVMNIRVSTRCDKLKND